MFEPQSGPGRINRSESGVDHFYGLSVAPYQPEVSDDKRIRESPQPSSGQTISPRPWLQHRHRGANGNPYADRRGKAGSRESEELVLRSLAEEIARLNRSASFREQLHLMEQILVLLLEGYRRQYLPGGLIAMVAPEDPCQGQQAITSLERAGMTWLHRAGEPAALCFPAASLSRNPTRGSQTSPHRTGDGEPVNLERPT